MEEMMDNTCVNGFEDDTMMEPILKKEEVEEKFSPNLDAIDDNCCTYAEFLRTPVKKRRLTLDEHQTLYLCLTCCPKIRKILEDCARICSACSYHCHENHELVEWYTKRNLFCDCPTDEIPKAKCKLSAKLPASPNKTNKTSKILNSTRKRPYPDSDADPQSDIVFDTMENLSVIEQNQQYTSNFPHRLIGYMYRLDLSVLCLFRKIKYEEKYPLLSIEFKNKGSDKFDIILRDEYKSIYVQIEHMDTYKSHDIGYPELFGQERRTNINQYLDKFIKYLLPTDGPLNIVEYFVMYTNAGLDITEDNELSSRRYRLFYPFTFVKVIKKCNLLLSEFLFTNDNAQGRGFYQFSPNKLTRKELLKRLNISPAMQSEIQSRNLSQDELKNQFLDKLVFAVNQPNREELNMVIKREVADYGNSKCSYSTLQKQASSLVEASPKVFYETNLLTSILHDMFTRRKIVSINSERKKLDTFNDITVHYKNKIAYIKVIFPPRKVSYAQLFSIQKSNCSLNSLFSLFLRQSHESLTHFIVYSYTPIDIDKEMALKRQHTKVYYPVKFVNVDVQEKEYKILRNRSYINEAGLYKFSNKKSTRKTLLELLTLPANMQNESFSEKTEKELKKNFIDKLIFALNQPNNKGLKNSVKKEIKASEVPYSCEELNEIALRWSESHELGSISLAIMEKLLEDIRNNRLSYSRNQMPFLEEIRQFAKYVIPKKGLGYEQLLEFLVKERSLQILKSKGIHPLNLCSILKDTGSVTLKVFKNFYDLLLDEEGNKTKYLITFEENGISFKNLSSILAGSKGNAAQVFKSLFDSWFDEEGNRTKYLRTLEKEGLNLIDVCKILRGSSGNASKAFKDLYDLCFEDEENKSQYLKNLEMQGIHLTDMTTILSGANVNAVEVFKEFYAIWFDKDGQKTKLFKILEEEGLDLSTVLSIVSGAKTNAAIAFKHLYRLWFDTDGKKAQCLRVFEENGIHLPCISNVLKGAGANAAKVLKDLYEFCFDKEGKKTQYLINLEEIEINLTIVFNILIGAGNSAPRTFKKLFHLLFDEDGNKSHYVRSLEERGISLQELCISLGGAGPNAATSFKDSYDLIIDEKRKGQYIKVLKENGLNLGNISNIFSGVVYKTKQLLDLYDLWFDEKENKNVYVKTFEEQGIDLPNISNILSGAGASAHKLFKDFYEMLFDEKGNKTEFLETLEENGIDLANLCNTLHGSGVDLSKAISEFYYTFLDDAGNRNPLLNDFLEKKGEGKSFKMQNLFDILKKSGAKTRDAFEQLHNVCFNDKGERTELLDDFYKAGFKPSNLANLLNGTGITAAESLNNFHSICFNENHNPTNILDDFIKAGFTCSDLCSLLSGTPNSIEILHDFCFVRQTKKYLKHLLNDTDGFPPAYLSKIVHASGADICSVLRDFHCVCFNEDGNRTQVLDDFYNAGFSPRQLANILSMTGSRASFTLNNLHKLCFGQENYLSHFFTEQDLFSPKKLSKMLCGTGINVCFSFEKLHNLCFDAEGNNTKYFTKLMKHNTTSEILEILHEKAVTFSNTFSDDKSYQEPKIKIELLEN